jgi:hypothetical protein
MTKESGLLYDLSVIKDFLTAAITSNMGLYYCHYISLLIMVDMEPVTRLSLL